MSVEKQTKPAWWRPFDQAWLQVDPRALGLFRIFFGILCFYDVFRRYQWIETFYSNTGVLSNHFSLFRPHSNYNFSLLFTFSNPEEVKLFFIITMGCLLAFTLGVFTKFFHVVCMLCIISIHSRNVMLENGGDVVMNLWWLWTLWLPLGARYSLDALRQSLRKGSGERPPDLREPLRGDRTPVRSLAMFAILCQLTVIYLFNTLHKGGAAWMDGSAVSWVLEQDRLGTHFGQWAKDALPMWVFKGMTWGTLVIEGLAPVLLLTPFFVVFARRIAITLLTGLHVGIWVLTDVGLFSPVMLVSFFLLLSAADIDLLGRWLRRLSGPPIRVWYDGGCGICHLFARVGRRLDRLGNITWHGTADDPLPHQWTAETLATRREESIIVDDPSERVWVQHRAIARIVRALPLGVLIAWIFAIPGVSHLAGWGYGRFAARRHRVSAWAGYGECGLTPPPPAVVAAGATEKTGLQRSVGRVWGLVSLAVLVFFMAATAYQNLVENRWVRNRVKVTQPEWSRKAVQYGRFFQGWSMFAPDAPKRDMYLVIDVELPDGTRVDPQTGQAPAMVPADFGPMDWDQMWGSFSQRIGTRRNASYRNEFSKWLRNHEIRRLELPPGQRVKSFKVYYISDHSPVPGSGEAPKIYDQSLILEWPPPPKEKG